MATKPNDDASLSQGKYSWEIIINKKRQIRNNRLSNGRRLLIALFAFGKDDFCSFYTRKRFLKIDLFYSEIKSEKELWLKSLRLEEGKIINNGGESFTEW